MRHRLTGEMDVIVFEERPNLQCVENRNCAWCVREVEHYRGVPINYQLPIVGGYNCGASAPVVQPAFAILPADSVAVSFDNPI